MFSRPAIKAQMGFCSLGCRLNRFILWWKGKGQGAAVALAFLPLGSWFLGGGAGKCPLAVGWLCHGAGWHVVLQHPLSEVWT